MDKERCKQYVVEPGGFHQHQCYKPIWKEGYCKIHHPSSVAKREKEKEERYEKKRKKDPYHRFFTIIAELNTLITKLKKKEAVGIGVTNTKKVRTKLERIVKGK